METGFYWVGDSVAEPLVWFWDAGGFYKPACSVPFTMQQFNAAGLKILSHKITEPKLKSATRQRGKRL